MTVSLAPVSRALVRGFAASLLVASAAACYGGHQERSFATNTGGSIERGADVMRNRDCGSCHVIPGIVGADGLVGPPLIRMARRSFIAAATASRRRSHLDLLAPRRAVTLREGDTARGLLALEDLAR